MPYRPIIKVAERPAYQAIDSARTLTVLINEDSCGASRVYAGMSYLKPGQRSPSDIHPDMEEVFYVIAGPGKAVINHEEHRLEPGDVVYVERGVQHQFIADEHPLHLFWTFNAHPDEEFKEKFRKWTPVPWPA